MHSIALQPCHDSEFCYQDGTAKKENTPMIKDSPDTVTVTFRDGQTNPSRFCEISIDINHDVVLNQARKTLFKISTSLYIEIVQSY